MKFEDRRGSRPFRPREERLEGRLVLNGNFTVAAEVRAILDSSPGAPPIRPNTPVLPLESAFATASFIDPTDRIVAGGRASVGQRDFLAPFVTLNSARGFIKIGSSSSIQDHAKLVANPGGFSRVSGIFVGDDVVVGDGATIIGPSAIGATGGAATTIGANARIDGAIIEPGAFVGALARVGPGVVVPTGYRVLPGVNVTDDAEASTPSMGFVVRATSADTTAATRLVADNVALASGYSTLYQGNSATGGSGSTGPIPAPIAATGSTVYFGALNTVLGASGEPGNRLVAIEPTSGTPTFLRADDTYAPIASNRSFNFPARLTGAVTIREDAVTFARGLGRGDSIRADEGQPITIGARSRIGNDVSIHSPLGGVSTATTTTVTTAVTVTSTGVTTTTTTSTTVTTAGLATATPGTTTATTTGINAAGLATTGTTTTTIATRTTNLGTITIGKFFKARDGAVILGGPAAAITFGDDVTVGAGAVVNDSSIGAGAMIGGRAYVAGSTIAAGTVVPDGAIIVNNQRVGTVQW